MAAVPNTLRKSGVYHFRRAVPQALKHLLSRAELCCSLRTNKVELARVRSRRLYLQSEQLFEAASAKAMLSTEDLARLVQDFYHSALADENQVRLESRVVFDEANRQAIINYYQGVGERARHDLATNNLGAVERFATDLIAKHGLADKIDAQERAKIEQAILRAGCDYTEALRARFEGDFNYEPRDALLRMSLGRPPPAPAATVQSEVELGPLFSTAADAFREHQLGRKVWENQTALQSRKTYELFAEICGDRPLGSYVRKDATAFKNMLDRMPANYGKAPEYREMSARAIVAAASDNAAGNLLSARTVQRHMTALSTLWHDAIEKGEVKENIFAKFKFGVKKRARDQRAMWDTDQLRDLFNTPIWRGWQPEHRRTKKGKIVRRDEKFWIPLIAVFSGMREEEICQLRVEDIREQDAIWLFDINARDGRQLKNANAVRLIPIHSELIKMGFLAYVASQRKAGRAMLFHQLTPGGADSRFGIIFPSGSRATDKMSGFMPTVSISTLFATAEQELEFARSASHPAAVSAHYLLAGYYLDQF